MLFDALLKIWIRVSVQLVAIVTALNRVAPFKLNCNLEKTLHELINSKLVTSILILIMLCIGIFLINLNNMR